MKYLALFFFLIHSLSARAVFDSQDELNQYITDVDEFYEEYMAEEKDILATVGLNESGTCGEECGLLLSRPAVLGELQLHSGQPSPLNYYPVVLQNHSGKETYFVVYGIPVTGGCSDGDPSFISFGEGSFTSSIGTYVSVTGNNQPPTENYSYKVSDVPVDPSSNQRVIYLPFARGGIILFSVDQPLTHLATNPNSIAMPVATDTNDLNYHTVYGAVEFTFLPTACAPDNQITFDVSYVDSYGIPLFINMYTKYPLPTIAQNRPSGIYQSRHYTLCRLQKALHKATTALSSWTGLVLKSGSKILRVVSPGFSMSRANAGGTFNIKYFDDAATYGYSWANDVWTGPQAYYLTHQLTIHTIDGNSYIGGVQSQNFKFTNVSDPTDYYTIPWIANASPPNFTTSTALFNVADNFPGMTHTGSGPNNTKELTKQFSSAIVAGLIPGKVSEIPKDGFTSDVIAEYYKPNSHLSQPGPTTGPWYDLYSLGVHGDTAAGNIVYAYPYDDFLYQQSADFKEVAPSQATIDNTSYTSIVIGPYSDN